MAMFVHLTPEKHVKAILRSGISRLHTQDLRPSGVYAMPVGPNFYVSHQWLRELKRSGQRTICAVYFRIPDKEIVCVGYYNQEHRRMTAAQAAAVTSAATDREGYEVIVLRKVSRREIHTVRYLPQGIGWRYKPGAHELCRCMCIACNPPGTINSRKKGMLWETKNNRKIEAANQ